MFTTSAVPVAAFDFDGTLTRSDTLVSLLRSAVGGARRMPLVTFIGFTALGSILWNALLIGAGYWLGDWWGATAAVSHWANIAVIGATAVLVLWWLASRLPGWGSTRSRSGGTTVR